MKVKELIKFLETYDPEMRVVVNGYESGFDEVTKLYQVGIAKSKKKLDNYWDGEFEEVVVDDSDEAALLLPRKSF
jgi:hypothetical protein